MPSQKSTTHHDPFSPEHIRATWSGTASVEDGVLESGEPEYNTASSASTKPS